jgi:putative tricarboxylic transport membrane protein
VFDTGNPPTTFDEQTGAEEGRYQDALAFYRRVRDHVVYIHIKDARIEDGTAVYTFPGVGEDIGAWVSYDVAKRSSKHPEEYGKGSLEGLIASETGNNSAVAGAMIPVLSLAIPGSAPAAVLLAAMFINGVRPGPLIMIENPSFVFRVVAMVFLATVAMLVLGLSMVRWLVKVLQVPRTKLMPIVFVLCVIGAFALESRLFDIGVMVAFGIIGYLMREMDYPVAPMILGIILGDILDKNLRRALVLSDGDFAPFFTRPISLVLVVFILFTLVSKTAWFSAAMRAIGRGIRTATGRSGRKG